MARLLAGKWEGGVAFPLNIGKLFKSGWPIFELSSKLFGKKDSHKETTTAGRKGGKGGRGWEGGRGGEGEKGGKGGKGGRISG